MPFLPYCGVEICFFFANRNASGIDRSIEWDENRFWYNKSLAYLPIVGSRIQMFGLRLLTGKHGITNSCAISTLKLRFKNLIFVSIQS